MEREPRFLSGESVVEWVGDDDAEVIRALADWLDDNAWRQVWSTHFWFDEEDGRIHLHAIVVEEPARLREIDHG